MFHCDLWCRIFVILSFLMDLQHLMLSLGKDIHVCNTVYDNRTCGCQ